MRIALTGLSGAGKSEAGLALIQDGFSRVAFGDIGKRQLDDLIRFHFGFSAFTEDRDKKAKIRVVVEQWIEANYENIFNEFFEFLPEHAVNTRLMKLPEAQEWVNRGGYIVEIYKPGLAPATTFEQVALAELDRAGLIHHTIHNDGSIGDLHAAIRECVKTLSTCAASSPMSTTAVKTPPAPTASAPLSCGN